MLPPSLIDLSACILLDDSQANVSADIITPTITANAKLSVKTVIIATDIPVTISGTGTFPNKRKVHHSNVPMTTINITPISTAIGIISIYSDKKRINISSTIAATIPDKRPRPPDLILIKLCPTMAQPPMPPKKPVTELAIP